MRKKGPPARLRLALLAALFAPAVARADDGGGPRPLTVALSVSAGMQYDGRACALAGSGSSDPDQPVCLLLAGGTDLALLWRGRLGGAIGLFSSSGVAATTGKEPAIPDRISLPLAFEVRPLAFLRGADEASLRGRLLSGVALRLGPSLELVRTASDSAPGFGIYFSAAGEVPLTASRRGAVSLRLQLHVIGAPLVSLDGGATRSGSFESCAPDPGCAPLTDRYHGYGAVVQTYLGLVYYP